jgi:tRNA (mo5U34)-methyltransferase
MLRSSGFEILEHPENEVYICKRTAINIEQPQAVYPLKN